jgi:hypothetical protein
MRAIQWAVGAAVLALAACGGTVSDTDSKDGKRSGVESAEPNSGPKAEGGESSAGPKAEGGESNGGPKAEGGESNGGPKAEGGESNGGPKPEGGEPNGGPKPEGGEGTSGNPPAQKVCEGNKAELDCRADKAGCQWIPEKTVKNENGGTSTQAARCVKPG